MNRRPERSSSSITAKPIQSKPIPTARHITTSQNHTVATIFRPLPGIFWDGRTRIPCFLNTPGKSGTLCGKGVTKLQSCPVENQIRFDCPSAPCSDIKARHAQSFLRPKNWAPQTLLVLKAGLRHSKRRRGCGALCCHLGPWTGAVSQFAARHRLLRPTPSAPVRFPCSVPMKDRETGHPSRIRPPRPQLPPLSSKSAE